MKNLNLIYFLFFFIFIAATSAATKVVRSMDISSLKEVKEADKVIIFFPRVFLPKDLAKYESSFRAHMAHLFFGLGKVQVSYATPPKKKYPNLYTLQESKKLTRVAKQVGAAKRKEDSVVEYQFSSQVKKTKKGFYYFFSLKNSYTKKIIFKSPRYYTKRSLQDLIHQMRVNGFGFVRGEKAKSQAQANGFLKKRKYSLHAHQKRKKRRVHQQIIVKNKKITKERTFFGMVRIFTSPVGIKYSIRDGRGKVLKGVSNAEHRLALGNYKLNIKNPMTLKKDIYPFTIERDETKFFGLNFKKPQQEKEDKKMAVNTRKVLKDEDIIEDEKWVGTTNKEMNQYYADLELLKQAELAEQKRWNALKVAALNKKATTIKKSLAPKIYVGVGFRYFGARPSKITGAGPMQAFELEAGVNFPKLGMKFGFGRSSITFTNINNEKSYAKNFKYLTATKNFTWANDFFGKDYMRFDYSLRAGLVKYFLIDAQGEKNALLSSLGGAAVFWEVMRLVVDLEFTVGLLPPPYANNAPLFFPAVTLMVGWGF